MPQSEGEATVFLTGGFPLGLRKGALEVGLQWDHLCTARRFLQIGSHFPITKWLSVTQGLNNQTPACTAAEGPAGKQSPMG